MIDAASVSLASIAEDPYIPPKPEVLSRLQELTDTEAPDVQQMAGVIAKDVGLASAVLRTVNSAFFGMQRHVSDIRQAAILLGPQQLTSIVSTYELRRALSGPACISLERFWDSAEDVARISVCLARELDLRLPLEDFYTVGLFRDCGIPVMAIKYPDYQQTLMEANADYERSITSIEQPRYGIDHTLVGYVIAEAWDIPEPICQSILQNHERDVWEVCEDRRLLTYLAVLKAAENIADCSRRDRENPDWPHHGLGALSWLQVNEEHFGELVQSIPRELHSGDEI